MRMKNNLTSYTEESFPDWTVEEFDSIQENHHFSRRYKSVRNVRPSYTLLSHMQISSGMLLAMPEEKAWFLTQNWRTMEKAEKLRSPIRKEIMSRLIRIKQTV